MSDRSLTVQALIRDAVRENIYKEREMFQCAPIPMQGERIGNAECGWRKWPRLKREACEKREMER